MTDSSQVIKKEDLKPQKVIDHPFPFSVGPRLIRNVLCPDGSQRTAYCSDKGADTAFSVPARVYAKGRTVAGFVTKETLEGWSVETPDDPAVWKFVPYSYRKNGNVLVTPE